MLLQTARKKFDFYTTKALAWKAVIDLLENENPEPSTPRPRYRVARKVDRDGVDKTLEFLKSREGLNTTITQVCKKFGITPMAAGWRLYQLTKRGVGVERVTGTRGVYVYSE